MMHETGIAAAARTGRYVPCRRRRLAPFAARSATMATVAALMAGGTAWADPPPAVEIMPNAIETPDEPMEIAIHGAPGQKLYLFILRNCDNDWNTPEVAPRPGCDPRISTRQIELNANGQWREHKRIAEVPADLYGQKLWLRVSLNPDGRWPYGDAMFTMVSELCSVWDTVIHLFTHNPCETDIQATLLPQRHHDENRPAVLLEARILTDALAINQWRQPKPVPSTRGATGVAWADANTLLVTVGHMGTHSTPQGKRSSRTSLLAPGLYRINTVTNRRKRLARAAEGEILTAPYAVSPEVIVFVRERAMVPEGGTVATLAVWKRGRVLNEFPLRYTVHQILGSSSDRMRVLVYSRWNGIPTLLQIDLNTGAVTNFSFVPQLFHAAMRAPGSDKAAIAVHDNAGHDGWDIILTSGNGTLIKDLIVGPGDDLMPAWHPAGNKFAFLGQAEEREEAQ